MFITIYRKFCQETSCHVFKSPEGWHHSCIVPQSVSHPSPRPQVSPRLSGDDVSFSFRQWGSLQRPRALSRYTLAKFSRRVRSLRVLYKQFMPYKIYNKIIYLSYHLRSYIDKVFLPYHFKWRCISTKKLIHKNINSTSNISIPKHFWIHL